MNQVLLLLGLYVHVKHLLHAHVFLKYFIASLIAHLQNYTLYFMSSFKGLYIMLVNMSLIYYDIT